MYLKSIEVYGFKSFANKILFNFEHGITGIVGPNGSGKSNVADAVRWVLGEQSAKQLRGAKMEDVIFSGTETRKPHGSAYVAITLDNSDHSLPVDYEEVTIARRVYRSGESEYLINGTVCRLRDVHSMFFDTGIGKEGYSIIGQGQIERILSGKPEDRRELFDEAAGIVKYKKNRAATEKALENERQNLYRVNDILSELEKQVGPLREQSEVAKKYIIFKEELKRFDVNVFLLEKARVKKLIDEYQEKLEIVTNDSLRLTSEYEKTKEEYNKLEEDLENYNQKIDSTKNKVHDLKLTNERAEGESKVLAQQITNAKQNDEHINSQIDRIVNEINRQLAEKTEFLEKKTHLDETLSNADSVLAKAKNNSDEISQKIESYNQSIEKCKGDIIEYMNENSTLKTKVGRYDTMLENINFRKTQLNQRYLQFKSDEMKDKEEYDQYNVELEKVEADLLDKQNSLADVDTRLDSNTKNTQTIKEDLLRLNSRYNSAKSKLEALRNITERYDGYGNSIRRVMEQKDTNPGIVGVVADIIKVDKKYEIAIETALGGSIQNIVTDNDITAKKVIQYLKDNKYGRATFLPLNTISGNISFGRPEALKEEGVIGIASDLVKIEDAYLTVSKHLLGRILVVDHIDHAIKIAKKYNQSLRIVTLEGESLTPGGAMTGGAFKNSSNLLGRKRELDDLTKEVNEVKLALMETDKKDREYKIDRDSLKSRKESLSDDIHGLYIQKNTIVLNIEQVSKKLSESANAFASVQKENRELEAQIEEINANKNSLMEDNEQQISKKDLCEATIKDYENSLEVERENLKNANEEISKLMLEFNTVKQQDDFIQENIKRINMQESKLSEELAGYESRVTGTSSEISTLTNHINELKNAIEGNKIIITNLETELSTFTEARNAITISHKEFFKRREELNDEIGRLDKSAFRISAQVEKVNEQNDLLSQYMWEEYELTYHTAIELRDDNLTDLDSLKRELTAVKNKIKALGDVNVNAIEDYKSVSERYEFLRGQHDDIVKAEENLKQVIAELDIAMREQFSEKFAEIQKMFDVVFKELFGGGKASLELVDDVDILEAGVKIIAQPPGKKLQNMMQLSGGEKSLTAIALLFAIQSLKPSPFCLLDEIEAALDDSNVKRFANYLSKLTKDTQFIVITHRKGTMEAANVLYGITMQEKGVSTLVSVKLIENELDK